MTLTLYHVMAAVAMLILAAILLDQMVRWLKGKWR